MRLIFSESKLFTCYNLQNQTKRDSVQKCTEIFLQMPADSPLQNCAEGKIEKDQDGTRRGCVLFLQRHESPF